MTTTKLIDLFITAPARVLGGLETPFLAVLRLWLGWEFFKSGWLKITSWDSTLFLFREEYRVP
ncbi:MAG TPA: hypothetical protein VLD39_06020, partial [Gammaproteobacteria bacterium]|nr:hypothetical protein [Gammaproteobacteria bacterium]